MQESFSGNFFSALEKYLEKYFDLHNGDLPTGMYNSIMSEVEKSLISVTLKHTNMNQMQASKILGINRNTLRKKMQSM